MITEISDLQARALVVAAKDKERAAGQTIEEILIDIIYTAEDPHIRIEAIRLYYTVIYNSDLTMDDLKESFRGELLSFEGKQE